MARDVCILVIKGKSERKSEIRKSKTERRKGSGKIENDMGDEKNSTLALMD